MTPFGEKLRGLRAERGETLQQMAAALGVSAAYLSALEHGKRGRPNRRLVHNICQHLGIIWDDAEELQRLADVSHPRVVVDTAGLSSTATLLANRLSERIGDHSEERLAELLQQIEQEP